MIAFGQMVFDKFLPRWSVASDANLSSPCTWMNELLGWLKGGRSCQIAWRNQEHLERLLLTKDDTAVMYQLDKFADDIMGI